MRNAFLNRPQVTPVHSPITPFRIRCRLPFHPLSSDKFIQTLLAEPQEKLGATIKKQLYSSLSINYKA